MLQKSSAFLSDQTSTIYSQLSWVSDRACRIGGSASVLPNVTVVDTGYDQHAGSLAQHGRGDAGSWIQFLALEAPGEGDGHVSLWDDTSQLCKFTGVNNISAKGEWNNAGRF